jgi:uncharacterized protein (DUF2141 family)
MGGYPVNQDFGPNYNSHGYERKVLYMTLDMKPTVVLLLALALPPLSFHFADTATIVSFGGRGESGLTLLRAVLTQAQPSSEGVIQVEIDGLRNDKGQVLCALYSSADGFPTKGEKALAHAKSPVTSGHAVCEFLGIAASTYALSAFHDENSNGRLDRNVMGIPREGVGASNNAKGHFGPPKFDAAAFRFSGSRLVLKIVINYL